MSAALFISYIRQHSRPAKEDRGDGLEDLKDIINRQELPVEFQIAILTGHGVESSGGGDGENENDEQDRRFALEPLDKVRCDQIADNHDGAGDHVEQDGLVIVVAETGNDQRTKGRDTARDDRDAKHHEGKDPLFDIEQTFKHLRPLECGVLGTGIVDSDTLKSQVLLLVGEETCSGDVRRKQKVGGNDGNQTDRTVDEEDVLVDVELTVDDMSETIRNEGSEHECDSLVSLARFV